MSGRRLTLAIETSNPSIGAGVALGEAGGRVLGEEPVDAGTRRGDDLMAAIDRLGAHVGAGPGDLGAIVVSVGPGAYTSLRVAVTTANVLGEAVGASVFGAPAWAAVARATPVPAWPAAVCLASKGETTCAAVLASAGDGGSGHRVITGGDLAGLGAACVVGDAHLPAGVREAAVALGIPVVEPVLRAGTLIGMHAAGATRPAGPGGVEPIYAREPDAVTQWRARHG